MAKTERKKLVDKLDQLTSQIVRLYEHGKCEHCGKEATQVHHYFTRSRYSVRWDFDNLLAVCFGCHTFWCHKYFEECRDYLISRIGEESFSKLKLKSNKIANFSVVDLRQMVEEYKTLLDNLKAS